MFQDPAFLDPWFEAYTATHDPVLVTGMAAGGELVGFLPLARERATGILAPAGTHQAEYHGWLASPVNSSRFITRALGAPQDPPPLLRFTWLAPGTPLPSPPEWRAAGIWPVTLAAARGLRECPATPDGAWRRNRSTRSRLNRLARHGPLRLRRLTTVADLQAVIPRIAECVDFRHAALHGHQPFADDPNKAPFHLALLARGVLHATVLEAGDELLAAHLGAISGRCVLLGVLAHAPEHAAQSPGKILLHMLADLLGAEGYASFDLTPGDDYKLRFATRTDHVTRLDCHYAPLPAARARARLFVGRVARAVAGSVGSDPARIRGLFTGLHGRTTPRPAELTCWRATSPVAPGNARTVPPARVERNQLRDLLDFQAEQPARAARRAYLMEAQERLGAGQDVLTITEGGHLVAWAWEQRRESGASGARQLEVGAACGEPSALPDLLSDLVAAACAEPPYPEEVLIVTRDPLVEAALRTLGWERTAGGASGMIPANDPGP